MEIETNNKNHKILEAFFFNIIKHDYILLDLPYYPNVGDVLIWEATLQLLKKNKHRCLYSCSVETYRKPRINKDTILLFSGGGNFGDLWEKHQSFRHRVMEDFPDNPIVQLPQSVWFENEENLLKDVQCYNKHKGSVIICTRDKQSFNIIKKNYSNVTPLLLPDMVLALDINKVLKRNRIKTTSGAGTLYFKRDDKEFVEKELNFNYDAEGDWPCRKVELECIKKHNILIHRLNRLHIPQKYQLRITDYYYKHIIKNAYIKDGIDFLMPYREVYATRLHAAILALLIGKKVYLLDNTYHKCSGVYDLWIKDYENISLI